MVESVAVASNSEAGSAVGDADRPSRGLCGEGPGGTAALLLLRSFCAGDGWATPAELPKASKMIKMRRIS